MPQTIKDADGKDVEVFTAEEVKAQETAALEQYQKDHPDQSAALTEATTALEKAQADLKAATEGGGDDKDKNFAALRVAVKAAEDKAAKAATDALAAIEVSKNAPTVEYKTDLFDTASSGDKTMREKIEIRYNELSGMPERTKAEVRLRMEAAMKLAVDNFTPGMLDRGVLGAGSRGDGGTPLSGGQENDNSKAMRGVLGITDEQAKKFAPQPGQPGYKT